MASSEPGTLWRDSKSSGFTLNRTGYPTGSSREACRTEECAWPCSEKWSLIEIADRECEKYGVELRDNSGSETSCFTYPLSAKMLVKESTSCHASDYMGVF